MEVSKAEILKNEMMIMDAEVDGLKLKNDEFRILNRFEQMEYQTKSARAKKRLRQQLRRQLSRAGLTTTLGEQLFQKKRRQRRRKAEVEYVENDPEVKKFQEAYKCIICWNVLYRPMRLTCNHFMCELCLHTNIITQINAKGGSYNREFTCPTCRQLILTRPAHCYTMWETILLQASRIWPKSHLRTHIKLNKKHWNSHVINNENYINWKLILESNWKWHLLTIGTPFSRIEEEIESIAKYKLLGMPIKGPERKYDYESPFQWDQLRSMTAKLSKNKFEKLPLIIGTVCVPRTNLKRETSSLDIGCSDINCIYCYDVEKPFSEAPLDTDLTFHLTKKFAIDIQHTSKYTAFVNIAFKTTLIKNNSTLQTIDEIVSFVERPKNHLIGCQCYVSVAACSTRDMIDYILKILSNKLVNQEEPKIKIPTLSHLTNLFLSSEMREFANSSRAHLITHVLGYRLVLTPRNPGRTSSISSESSDASTSTTTSELEISENQHSNITTTINHNLGTYLDDLLTLPANIRNNDALLVAAEQFVSEAESNLGNLVVSEESNQSPSNLQTDQVTLDSAEQFVTEVETSQEMARQSSVNLTNHNSAVNSSMQIIQRFIEDFTEEIYDMEDVD
jgi:hypothetical protein